MVELFANSAASDLGLHCLPVTVKGSPVFNGLIVQMNGVIWDFCNLLMLGSSFHKAWPK